MGVLFFQKQKDIKLYTRKYQDTRGKISFSVSAQFLKDTIIGKVYSGRKLKATCFIYIQGSQYCDAE